MRIDRYELFGPFATGGMASVHFGKLFASAGFERIVAIKVPHAHVLSDPQFRSMFVDEARIVARIRNPHVVSTLDIIEEGDVLYQVMEYANGPSLSSILRSASEREEQVPLPIVLAILSDTLEGLHAAHEATDDRGASLHVVHRDVSPQNILVTDAGVAQIIDFGIATATGRLHLTEPGSVKGKASYMAPEQVHGRPLDRRADIYAAGVVFYEALTGVKPFVGDEFPAIAMKHVLEPAPDPRAVRPEISEELSLIVLRALEKEPADRFATARAMAEALLTLKTHRASAREVAAWLTDDISREFFAKRGARIAALSAAEEVRASIVPKEQTTAVELASTRIAPIAPRRSRGLLYALAGGLSVLLLGIVAVLSTARRHVEAPPTPLVAASAAPEVPSSLTQLSPLAAPEAPSSSAPLVRAKAPPRANPNAKKAAAPDSSASAGAGVRPPCCAGDLRLRFSNCVDNCPAGL